MLTKIFTLLLFLTIVVSAQTYRHYASTGTGDRTQLTTWATAGGPDTLNVVQATVATAGDVAYLKSGTYTFTNGINWSDNDGTITAPHIIIGVKTATTNEGAAIDTGDWVGVRDSSNMPRLDLTGKSLLPGAYYEFRNLYIIGDSSYVCKVTSGNSGVKVYNCVLRNTATESSSYAGGFDGGRAIVDGCLVLSDNCNGIRTSTASNTSITNTQFANINNANQGIGVVCGVATGYIDNCIFLTCRIGINLASTDDIKVRGNLFLHCDSAVTATDANSIVCENNIVDSTVCGFAWGTTTNGNKFDTNHEGGNVTTMYAGVATTGVYSDLRKITGAPVYRSYPDTLALDPTSPGYGQGRGVDGLW